ncbi:Tenascin [Giardia duodenalis]|uniref:Tenascin n=1 Tax=Giardia intestinalis TaxID=5741 RepID=V6TR86_GIAIN|nr:Tenascin [Giardia intestinalis]
MCLSARRGSRVCTGHGECYRDACICAEGYHGDLCDHRVRNVGAVLGVTASLPLSRPPLLSAARCYAAPVQ